MWTYLLLFFTHATAILIGFGFGFWFALDDEEEPTDDLAWPITHYDHINRAEKYARPLPPHLDR